MNIDLVNVSLELLPIQLFEHPDENADHAQLPSLARIDFIKSKFEFESFSDWSKTIDLVSEEVIFEDTRQKGNYTALCICTFVCSAYFDIVVDSFPQSLSNQSGKKVIFFCELVSLVLTKQSVMPISAAILVTIVPLNDCDIPTRRIKAYVDFVYWWKRASSASYPELLFNKL